MTTVVLFLAAGVFFALAWLLSTAEAAFLALSRQAAEELTEHPRRKLLPKILAKPTQHTYAIRFWRVWTESLAGIALACAFFFVFAHPLVAAGLAALVTAVLSILVVGFASRQYGQRHAAKTVLYTAWIVRFLTWLLGPASSWLVAMATPKGARPGATFLTEEHFRDMLERASETQQIDDAEAELIHSVFELDDTLVRSLMVPRTDMVTISADSSAEDAIRLFMRSGCSRVPVIGEDSDDVRGVVHLKDVIGNLYSDELNATNVLEVARRARFVPDSKHVNELLQEFQRESTHFAIVVDEYGGTAGLITLEDLLEELVGEIDDEYDSDTPDYTQREDGSYEVDAGFQIEHLGELFDRELRDEDVDTVAGLMGKLIGTVPIVGSVAEIDGLRMEVRTLEGRRNRPGKIIVTELDPPVDNEAEDDGESESNAGATTMQRYERLRGDQSGEDGTRADGADAGSTDRRVSDRDTLSEEDGSAGNAQRASMRRESEQD